MRSPLAIALLFTLALLGWLASRPLQEMLSGDAGPAATAEVAPAPAASPELPPMRVRVTTSVAAPVAPELVVNGRTAPVRSVDVKAETSGRVVETPVAEGSLVETGQALLRLDVRDRESRIAEMEARLAQRELEFEAARRLGEKQFQSETRVAEARAQLEEARAALHQARLDLERVTIGAPFAGVLEDRPMEIGDFVEVGDVVARVIDQDPYLVVGDVPETMVGRFQPGQPGVAILADGRQVEGRISFVATQADPGTRTFRVELSVPNPEQRFQAGMSARIASREPPVMAHEVSAGSLVLADDGRVGIKAVDEAGIVTFHQARIVKAGTDSVWLAGLPEELRLISTGQGFVAEGQRVEAVPAEPPDEAAIAASGAGS